MKLAIASGKGGTGKTTLAVNLAIKASKIMDTALIDLDVEEPNGVIFIKGKLIEEKPVFRYVPQWIQDKCSLCGKCSTWCAYNALIKLGDIILVMPNLCHSCFACSELCPEGALLMKEDSLGKISYFQKDALHFIESRIDIGLEQAAPLIGQGLDYLEENFGNFQLKIIDSPPGTACSMVAAVKTADFVLLVTEPTPFGLHDLKLAIETVRQLSLPFGVVINRDGIGNDELRNYLRNENIPIIASIPHKREIAETYSRGELLTKIPEVDRALDEILDYLGGLK